MRTITYIIKYYKLIYNYNYKIVMSNHFQSCLYKVKQFVLKISSITIPLLIIYIIIIVSKYIYIYNIKFSACTVHCLHVN